jgi:hypothetical protein
VIKTFIFGIFLGIAGVFTALHFVTAVDQEREASIISVTRNGGNTEVFHVKLPMDRIMIGAQGQTNSLPPGMQWPDDPMFGDVRAELFKLRNSRDAIIGVASRFALSDPEFGSIIEWVLHLPARGSVFIRMQPQTADGGRRIGALSAGTREFSSLFGRVSERWVADTSGADGALSGRIELLMNFVSDEQYVPGDEVSE